MSRPSKWNTPTTSIRVPAHAVDRLLELARALDMLPPTAEPDPEFAEYVSFVQNLQPCLFSIQDGAELRRYWIECSPPTFEEWKLLCEVQERLLAQMDAEGWRQDARLYVISRMVEQVFKPLPELTR